MPLTPLLHPLLSHAGIRHGFFTRGGGVSTGIYESLNTGVGSNDDPALIQENRRRIAEHLGGTPDDFAACYQVHSAVAHVADAGWKGERPQGDASVTGATGVICAVLTADCAPILLADPQARVVAAAHAGWKGALDGIVEATVHAMISQGAQAQRIVAVVGPCITQASYEVGADYQARFEQHDATAGRFFAPGVTADKRQFDLPGYVLWRLEGAGVARVAFTGDDTRTDAARFYSNRRAHLAGEPDFGRQMSAIVLEG